eukprot:m.352280 g.352280  ORF g.352280 m.352280 type:complete len:146 (-) comp16482_c0_seq1:242-679(-)
MSAQDWDPVVLRKSKTGAKTKSAMAAAQRSGGVATEKKYGAGGNRQHGAAVSAAALDAETEAHELKRVSLTVGQAIMKARNAKGMSQKDLSTRINEKPSVVQEYEANKAIPNQGILAKLERQLGVKLRGKDIGAPLPARGSKAKK